MAREVRERLVDEGHEAATFAIVAAGPNSASPHHEPGGRVIAAGETVTLDFLLDRRIPENCVLIPAGYEETVALGGQDMVHVEAGQ